jgi:erythritol transport system ATP-binding protein
MRLLAGAEEASAGEIWKSGARLRMSSPRDAAAAGIAIVHQELAVLGNLDVAENIFAGRELVYSSILLDRPQQEARGLVALQQLRKPIDVRTLVGDLSLGNRQVVELARSLAHGADVLILDEPTSALSATEAESLFRMVEELKTRGVAIIYISHRLHELLYLGDFFTVLRDGRLVGEGVRGEVDRPWIVERMSGRDAAHAIERVTRTYSGVPMLEISGLRIKIAGQLPAGCVDLTVGSGEIVGIYGLLGSGRTELLETIAGLRSMDAGIVQLSGVPVSLRSVADALAEDRQRDGLIPELSIRENMSLASIEEFAKGGWVRHGTEAERVRELAAQMHIAAHDLELPVTTLSGGNQQKVVLARCLMRRPKVLLLDEPTRGVDVGAKAEIYATLRLLAANGLCILFATSEIEEARLLADRILVLAQGGFTAEIAGSDATDEALFAAASPVIGVAA